MDTNIVASVEINAPPGEVFEWLIDRSKLSAWAGMDQEWLPADSSQLKAGYRSRARLPTPSGFQEADIEVTAYDPPRLLELVETYDGGRSSACYTLEESAPWTVVRLETRTQSADPALTLPDQLEAQVDQMPFLLRMFAHHQMHKAESLMASGFQDPQFQAALQSQATAQLERLKQLIEPVRREH